MKTIAANSRIKKIFLVDDDAFCLELYGRVLANLGYANVLSFSKSADCLNQLTLQPDLIFLDYYMDNLNGIDMLKKIKRFNPNIIIVFISSQEDINIAVNALKYGAYDYITKNDFNEGRIKLVMEKAAQVKEILYRRNKRSVLGKVVSAVSGSLPFLFTQKLLKH